MAANNIVIVLAASVGLATEVTNLYSKSVLWWVSFVSYLTFLSLGLGGGVKNTSIYAQDLVLDTRPVLQ